MINFKLNFNQTFIIILSSFYIINQLINHVFIDIFFLVIIFFFYISKILKDFKINLNKFFFFIPLIVFSFFPILFYFKNGYKLDLKIWIYLVIIISSILIFKFKKKDLKLFFFIITVFSIFLFLYGTFGWLKGGENESWGKIFVYFGYTYLPSTRNEDMLIFLLSFIISLNLLLFNENKKLYLIFNQINLLAILLSFSRGGFISLIISIIIFTVLNRKILNIRKIANYLLISSITILIGFNSYNKTVDINLYKYFLAKMNSSVNFLKNYSEEKANLEFTELENNYVFSEGLNNTNYKSIEKTSLYSLQLKMQEWRDLFSKNRKSHNYYENSLIYIYKNYNIFPIIILIFFFSNLTYFYLLNLNDHHKRINFQILVIFFFLNLIYNYLDDFLNYLILLMLLIDVNMRYNLFIKVKTLLFAKK